VSIREPRTAARYLFDPDTPREFATVRLSAAVTPATEDVVWLVDGQPVAQVGYPHEARWPLAPGKHVIRAALAHGGEASAPVTVVVVD
jgi:penicillin-binding protein 1C